MATSLYVASVAPPFSLAQSGRARVDSGLAPGIVQMEFESDEQAAVPITQAEYTDLHSPESPDAADQILMVAGEGESTGFSGMRKKLAGIARLGRAPEMPHDPFGKTNSDDETPSELDQKQSSWDSPTAEDYPAKRSAGRATLGGAKPGTNRDRLRASLADEEVATDQIHPEGTATRSQGGRATLDIPEGLPDSVKGVYQRRYGHAALNGLPRKVGVSRLSGTSSSAQASHDSLNSGPDAPSTPFRGGRSRLAASEQDQESTQAVGSVELGDAAIRRLSSSGGTRSANSASDVPEERLRSLFEGEETQSDQVAEEESLDPLQNSSESSFSDEPVPQQRPKTRAARSSSLVAQTEPSLDESSESESSETEAAVERRLSQLRSPSTVDSEPRGGTSSIPSDGVSAKPGAPKSRVQDRTRTAVRPGSERVAPSTAGKKPVVAARSNSSSRPQVGRARLAASSRPETVAAKPAGQETRYQPIAGDTDDIVLQPAVASSVEQLRSEPPVATMQRKVRLNSERRELLRNALVAKQEPASVPPTTRVVPGSISMPEGVFAGSFTRVKQTAGAESEAGAEIVAAESEVMLEGPQGSTETGGPSLDLPSPQEEITVASESPPERTLPETGEAAPPASQSNRGLKLDSQTGHETVRASKTSQVNIPRVSQKHRSPVTDDSSGGPRGWSAAKTPPAARTSPGPELSGPDLRSGHPLSTTTRQPVELQLIETEGSMQLMRGTRDEESQLKTADYAQESTASNSQPAVIPDVVSDPIIEENYAPPPPENSWSYWTWLTVIGVSAVSLLWLTTRQRGR